MLSPDQLIISSMIHCEQYVLYLYTTSQCITSVYVSQKSCFVPLISPPPSSMNELKLANLSHYLYFWDLDKSLFYIQEHKLVKDIRLFVIYTQGVIDICEKLNWPFCETFLHQTMLPQVLQLSNRNLKQWKNYENKLV